MSCQDVGSTNADIAGLGVIISFTVQAGLSFLLSLYYMVVEMQAHGLKFSQLLRAMFTGDNLRGRSSTTHATPYRPDRERAMSERKMELIAGVLKTISDAQILNGISLLIGSLVQHASMDLYHYHIVYDAVNFTGVSASAALSVVFTRKVALFYRAYLVSLFASLYLAFVILFGLRLRSWDDNTPGSCYHAERISAPGARHPYVDNIYVAITSLYLFGSLYCSFKSANVTLDEVLHRFHRASEDAPSRHRLINAVNRAGTAISLPGSSLLTLIKGFVGTRPDVYEEVGEMLRRSEHIAEEENKVYLRFSILVIALLQYPLHNYTLFQLRISNEPYLSGDSENEWGFGQIIALVLLASVVLECVRATVEYIIFAQSYKNGGSHSRAFEGLTELLVDNAAPHGWEASRLEPNSDANHVVGMEGGRG
ncbi:hypothetical protein F4779DRAFT_566716 [Xylariaceae sp. FL0662B]|nr:hypothetical protein F4779DRAFT_566716 [Xylariaceae sp. FL0662B]